MMAGNLSIIIQSSMLGNTRLRRNCPCLTEVIDTKQKLPESLYASFAFKDRITNHEFSYNQALANVNTSFKERFSEKTNAEKKLKHIISTYRFTKEFEMKCIKDKYRLLHKPHRQHPQSPQSPHTSRVTENHPNHTLNQQPLYFQECKEELRRVLATGKHVDSSMFRLKKQNHSTKQKVKVKASKWIKKDQEKENIGLGEEGCRVYERALNHMNYELRTSGEYLLNLPQKVKKRELIKSHFKRRAMIDENGATMPIERPLLKDSFDRLYLSPISKDTSNQQGLSSTQDREKKELIELVHLGYVNEASWLINTKPEMVWDTDTKGNNVYHVAAKEDNLHMLRSLFKAIPTVCSSALLSNCNKLGRTPLQKAEMLSNESAVLFITTFLKTHKD